MVTVIADLLAEAACSWLPAFAPLSIVNTVTSNFIAGVYTSLLLFLWKRWDTLQPLMVQGLMFPLSPSL